MRIHSQINALSAHATEQAGAHNYHNHPSGASEPSPADKALTHRLKAALSLIDVKILDHLIVAEKVFSFSAARIL
jgi:DNA repair protein RadC